MTVSSSSESQPGIGFWKCWGLSVGVMIGSGIFMLPAVLAPYGGIGFLGWLVSSVGAVSAALVLSRLAGRTRHSGGMYRYAQDALGDLVGFLVGWSYWVSLVFAITAISVAFAGYAASLHPALNSSLGQACIAALLIWTLTWVNLRGVGNAALVQLAMTVLKLIPLLVVIALAAVSGSASNLPPLNPQEMSPLKATAASALLTMWAFIGVEAAAVPAAAVMDAKRTIPRAIVAATLCVATVYVLSSFAVMTLVSNETLAQSSAPFVDAVKSLGWIAGPLIAFGAMVSTAGSLNGNILVSGQMPMAIAADGLAPSWLAKTNPQAAPRFALLLSATLATLLLALNFSQGLVAAFTFLISTSTLAVLAPYSISAFIELKHSRSSARGWAAVAVLALAYSVVAIAGAGLFTILSGLLLIGSGLPVFWWVKARAQSNGDRAPAG